MYNIYGHLQRRFGSRAAAILVALWYATLILATLNYSFEPQAEFNYLNI